MEIYSKRNTYILICFVLLVQAWGIIRGNYLLSLLIIAASIFSYMFYANKAVLVFIILSARIFFDSIPAVTTPKMAFGLSFTEIYTFGFMVFMLIYLLIYKGIKLDAISKGIAFILFSLAVTGAYHGNIPDFIDMASVWLYFLIAYSFFKYALRDIPISCCFKIIGFLSLYSFLNQLYAIARGVGEMHLGFMRYAGTYIHSLVIGEYLFFAIPAILYLFSKENRPVMRFLYLAMLVLYHTGILVAGYRTIWIATALFWFIYILFISKNKVFSISVVLLGIIIMYSSAGKMMAANLGQIQTMVENWDAVTNMNNHTYDRLLSKRFGMWKSIARNYIDSKFIEKIVGLGSNSIYKISLRNTGVPVYAHNEYISALIETGILGLLCLLVWMLTINYEINKYRHYPDIQHVQIIQSIVLSMSIIAFTTMPFRHLNLINYLAVYLGILPHSTATDFPSIKGLSIKEQDCHG